MEVKPIPKPPSFDGDLDGLSDFVVANVLPSRAMVESFHRALAAYVQGHDPLFVIRSPSPTKFERGTIAATQDGCRVRFSDNSPAWQVHYTLFQGDSQAFAEFGAFVESLSTHFFEVGRRVPKSVSKAGWYVAHVHPVRDRRRPFGEWQRQDAVRRFVRNIHPCNVFFVPLAHRRMGEDPAVIAHFASRLRANYGSVWDEFERLAGGEPIVESSPSRWTSAVSHPPRKPTASKVTNPQTAAVKREPVQASYRFSRLCFKRDIIEPLGQDEVFEVVTPGATFRMTKAQFSRDFAQVPATASYRERGVYHFAKVPARALKYIVAGG